jgi:hypothetical protein
MVTANLGLLGHRGRVRVVRAIRLHKPSTVALAVDDVGVDILR